MKTSLSCKGCLSVCQPKPDKYCIPLHFNDLRLTLCKTLAEHALKRALLIFLGKASSSRQLRPMSQSNASMAYACQNLCQTRLKPNSYTIAIENHAHPPMCLLYMYLSRRAVNRGYCAQLCSMVHWGRGTSDPLRLGVVLCAVHGFVIHWMEHRLYYLSWEVLNKCIKRNL